MINYQILMALQLITYNLTLKTKQPLEVQPELKHTNKLNQLLLSLLLLVDTDLVLPN
jgi:hypothetical protein